MIFWIFRGGGSRFRECGPGDLALGKPMVQHRRIFTLTGCTAIHKYIVSTEMSEMRLVLRAEMIDPCASSEQEALIGRRRLLERMTDRGGCYFRLREPDKGRRECAHDSIA